MYKKYIVRLTNEERTICEATIKAEKGTSEKLRRATILLRQRYLISILVYNKEVRQG